MPSFISSNQIQIGIDLATSIALILSAIGVMWRVGTMSKKLQKQQLEAAEERSRDALIESREQTRVTFLLEANREISRHIASLEAVFIAAASTPKDERHQLVDDSVLDAIRSCHLWLGASESQLIAIGTKKQITAMQHAKRCFLGSILPKAHSTHISPQELITSLRDLQKLVLIDTRVSLLSENEQEARELIEEKLLHGQSN